MCEVIAEHASEYAEWDSSAAIFLACGRPPRQGEKFYQGDRGRTLRLIVAAEHAKRLAGAWRRCMRPGKPFIRGKSPTP
jgi:gamma-glutamyltranspeptidase